MIRRAAVRYRDFLRLPDVATMLAVALVTRMPIGTLSLSMLLHVRARTGSFAVAGAAVGAFMAASAIVAPIVGRIVDRRGPRLLLIVTGTVFSLVLAVLLAAEALHLSNAAMIAIAAVAGVFTPPITVLTRTMWRYRFDDATERTTAYSLDAVLIELAFTLGPLLVALLLAVATPTAAFAMSWCFCAASVPLFLASPALKYWRHDPDAERQLLGPLTEPALLVVYASTFLFTFSLGLLEIGYPGFATAFGVPALSGVLLGLNSLGSAIGGLAYGALHLNFAVDRLAPKLLALMVLPVALQAMTDSPWILCALAFIAGLLIAPVFTVFATLVTTNAPSRYATEAFTWSSTCIISGIGAGNALGGRLLEASPPSATFALSAAIALAAALCATGTRTRSAPAT
ncbi:MAG TPA: MFS transporter [Casimicrobiaceae bacterium]|nr:MFS transporter [Casimicrobiaceae bacterium]